MTTLQEKFDEYGEKCLKEGLQEGLKKVYKKEMSKGIKKKNMKC